MLKSIYTNEEQFARIEDDRLEWETYSSDYRAVG